MCSSDLKEKGRRKDGNMMTFFQKALLPQHVWSTVKAPPPVASGSSSQNDNPAKITLKSPVAPLLSTSVPSSHTIRLLNQLRGNVVLLPSTIPTADDTNPLSAFSGEPATYVDAKMKPGELWEALAPIFHRGFDYGGRLRTGNVKNARGSFCGTCCVHLWEFGGSQV